MATSYPLVNFHFSVEWGSSKIGFSEVSGLSIAHDVIEYRHGASPEYQILKMPGMRRYSNIVLNRGSYKGDNEFFQWINTVSLSQVERRDLLISLLNENHEPVVVWKVRNAWPISLKFGELNAMKSELLIERLELAHEGISVENTQ